MKRINRIIALLSFTACVVIAAMPVSVQSSDIYFFFENEENLTIPWDSGGCDVRLPYSGNPQNSARTTEEARFGKGSMKTGGGAGATGFSGLLKQEQRLNFYQETGKITITTWVKPAEVTSVIFFRTANTRISPGCFSFIYVAPTIGPGSLRFTVTTASGNLTARSEPFSLEPGNWNHVAITFDAGEVVFYFNGQPVGSTVSVDITKIPAIEPPEKAGFGGLAGLSSESYADDLGFFGDRALSGDEIQKIYTNGLEVFVTGQ